MTKIKVPALLIATVSLLIVAVVYSTASQSAPVADQRLIKNYIPWLDSNDYRLIRNYEQQLLADNNNTMEGTPEQILKKELAMQSVAEFQAVLNSTVSYAKFMYHLWNMKAHLMKAGLSEEEANRVMNSAIEKKLKQDKNDMTALPDSPNPLTANNNQRMIPINRPVTGTSEQIIAKEATYASAVMVQAGLIDTAGSGYVAANEAEIAYMRSRFLDAGVSEQQADRVIKLMVKIAQSGDKNDNRALEMAWDLLAGATSGILIHGVAHGFEGTEANMADMKTGLLDVGVSEDTADGLVNFMFNNAPLALGEEKGIRTLELAKKIVAEATPKPKPKSKPEAKPKPQPKPKPKPKQ